MILNVLSSACPDSSSGSRGLATSEGRDDHARGALSNPDLDGARTAVVGLNGIAFDGPVPFTPTWSAARPGSSNWLDNRHDGATLFFARLGSAAPNLFFDVAVRLGGSGSTLGLTNTAEMSIGGGNWISLPAMPSSTTPALKRTQLNAVILPDASILVIGGTDENAQGQPVPVLDPILFRNGIGWTLLDTQNASITPRTYHSTAVLLPDGRVMTAGGEIRHPTGQGTFDYEVFEPQYLADGVSRPVGLTIPGATIHPGDPADPNDDTPILPSGSTGPSPGTTWQLTCGFSGSEDAIVSLDRIVVMAPGAITHHSDMSARYVELPSSAISASSRSFTVPDAKTLPRGYHMLFAVTTAGVPSRALWIKVQ